MRGPSPTAATTAGRPFTSDDAMADRLPLEPAAQEPDGALDPLLGRRVVADQALDEGEIVHTVHPPILAER